MPLRDSFTADIFYRVVDRYVWPRLSRRFTHPNHYTVLGVALAALVPPGFYLHPWLGMVFIILSGTADAMDGLAARRGGHETVFGAFLDANGDRLSDGFYLLGFWVLFQGSTAPMGAGILFVLGLTFTSLISYSKAKAEALGASCRIGLMERGVRILYLTGWALALCVLAGYRAQVLWWGLALYVLLTFATVIQRVLHIRVQLAR